MSIRRGRLRKHL